MKITPVQIGTLRITDIEPSPVSVDFVAQTMTWNVTVWGPRILYKINYNIGPDKFAQYIAAFNGTNFKNLILTDLGFTLL